MKLMLLATTLPTLLEESTHCYPHLLLPSSLTSAPHQTPSTLPSTSRLLGLQIDSLTKLRMGSCCLSWLLLVTSATLAVDSLYLGEARIQREAGRLYC